MRTILMLVALAMAAGFVGFGANLHTPDQKRVRLIANYQRMLTGNHLLDLNTGLPVVCDTDTDCYNKTGIDAGLAPINER